MESKFAISEYHDVQEIYTKIDALLAQPIRSVKRDKMEALDRKFMGTAVTNLTRMDFPRTYGTLELDRLILHPGGAFPLANVNLVLGAVTCAGKLSLILEYAEEAVASKTVENIKTKAMESLLDNWLYESSVLLEEMPHNPA